MFESQEKCIFKQFDLTVASWHMLGMRPWGHLATLICSLYSDMIELLPPLNIISAFMHFFFFLSFILEEIWQMLLVKETEGKKNLCNPGSGSVQRIQNL